MSVGEDEESERAALLTELQEFAREIGETPTRTRFNEEGPRSSSPYYRVFGSWNDALEAAGLTTNHENEVSEERLIRALRELDDELDRLPRFEDMEERGEFSGHTYLRRFGSWSDVKEAAGLESERRTSRRISREELRDELVRLAEELGKPPTQEEMNELGSFSQRPYYRVFDSWSSALRAVGFEPNHQNGYEVSTLVAELQTLADGLGYPPTVEQMDEHGRFSAQPYLTTFGSWSAAWDAAGLQKRDGNPAGRVSRDDLLKELNHLSNELERVPRRGDAIAHGRWSHTPFVREFGSWSRALNAAGFEPPREIDGDGTVTYYGPRWYAQRRRTLERDGYECQRCGMSDEEHRDTQTGGLHVHHKTKFRMFDEPSEANRLENLISLCRDCHTEAEREL
ncbi:homing endonuclease associated repeat-containing protein [Haloprofundus halophilus]|uniref:homing endonuclease associated repeat-containing protein n=1 Tax=Haloprofundus halophilus TaxID=2283527 RepID=UPI0018E55939|nr:HNH endonuclease [Haloprofundus halophilus]